jgi:hypothetical protein
MIIILFYPMLFGLASCQLNSGVKETPVIGQIAAGANTITGQSEKNETATLFAPRNYRNLQYQSRERYDTGTDKIIPSKITTFDEALGSYGDATGEDKAQFIRHCAGRIDANYYEWLEDYITGRASLTTGLDIFSKLLSTAGAVFTPASTVRALSGSSAFVQSANSSIETNFFLSLTILQQVPAMDNARRTTRGELETILTNPDFNIHRAADKLEALYMAGTQFTAMSTVTQKKEG